MTDGGEIRVGDAEREAVANRIRDAYVEGRLNLDELDARLDAIHQATTRNDLIAVGADLPEVKRQRRRSLVPWTFIEVNAALWGIWGAQSVTTGALYHPWPLVISVPWGVFEAVGVARRAARRRSIPPSGPELPAN